jgi:putative transposase
LASHGKKRESRWSESIAVGSNTFTTEILSKLGSRTKGRRIIKKGQAFQIREETESYNPLFDGEKGAIAPENPLNWQ